MEFSSTRHLFAYNNGDNITPGMGVQIDPGYGLSQFWDISFLKEEAGSMVVRSVRH